MEEVNELFVPENKLHLAVADANTLPTIRITKVTHCSSLQASFFITQQTDKGVNTGHGRELFMISS